MVVVDNKPKLTVSHLILLFDLDVEKFYYFAQEPFPCVFLFLLKKKRKRLHVHIVKEEFYALQK